MEFPPVRTSKNNLAEISDPCDPGNNLSANKETRRGGNGIRSFFNIILGDFTFYIALISEVVKEEFMLQFIFHKVIFTQYPTDINVFESQPSQPHLNPSDSLVMKQKSNARKN